MPSMPARIPASVFNTRHRQSTSPPKPPHVDPPRACTNGFSSSKSSTQASDSISFLRDAINLLDSKMSKMKTERDQLESHLERAVRMQSPVLRLPSELLGTIFLTGVMNANDDNPIMVSTLMLVCRYWNSVATGTPMLWSRISVNSNDSLEKARRRLQRSKACPLDITVNFEARYEHPSHHIMEQVIHAMDLFKPALWRTRTLHISVPTKPQAHAALLRCQEDAPMLENLSITVYHHMLDDHYSSPPLPLFNGHAPLLKSCSFDSFNFGWHPALVSGLQTLQLSGYFNGFAPSVAAIIGMLRQCPSLEVLTLRNMSDVDAEGCGSDDVFVPHKTIHMPRLRKLSFNNSGIMRTRNILGQITFPALQSLELYYLQNVTPVLQYLHAQSLTRLPLRNLRIESSFFNELKFLKLLQRVSLVSLELVDVEDASSSFLKNLTSTRPWICPKLQFLSLDGCTNIEWDSLREFVESRLPANPLTYSFHTSRTSGKTSSSARRGQPQEAPIAMLGPQRLSAIDVTRCQISREMVQWLRIYVPDVRCDIVRGFT